MVLSAAVWAGGATGVGAAGTGRVGVLARVAGAVTTWVPHPLLPPDWEVIFGRSAVVTSGEFLIAGSIGASQICWSTSCSSSEADPSLVVVGSLV